MKKYISILFILLVVCTALTGCGAGSKDDKISVVTTIFPEYDWVREITKGNEDIEVTMLLDKGVDLHSFQPTADDIVKISQCDMFIYVGGESDSWVDDALAEAINKDMVVVNLLDVLGDSAKEEELVAGMEGEEDEEGEAEGEEGPEYDEHVWLSLKNASILCQTIADQLCVVDAEHKDLYTTNVQSYIEKLEKLHQDYQTVVDEANGKTMLFGDRFPFRYLADDYGITYYAAFSGCSAESEASFDTITFLAKKMDELKLTKILQTESADGKIAETIRDNTKDKNQEILTMNSLQSTTLEDIDNGATYLGVMEENLEILKQALQ